jgi:hypothetical protein
VEFWFTPKRWITVLRSEAALTFEAFGLSCVVVLQEENMRLKQLVAELTLDKAMLQDVLSKKW